ncbi:hypothetical protein ID866_4060 [Astraeus odoratus]|nr:hypothetical protein ID866_4060 [Astraeus odoratus]
MQSSKLCAGAVDGSNNPASLTSRLGATIDVEQNHVRFLGDLILNLWDCGGQDAFMDSYLSIQRSTIFSHVGVMIYVFDVESREMAKDLEYYHDCLDGLSQFSKDANVFLLVHKMDLIREGERAMVLQRKTAELEKASGDVSIKVHGTSIYDETLYKACLPCSRYSGRTTNGPAEGLVKHKACNATEVILFERTTFLVIATSSSDAPDSVADPIAVHALDPKRYERTSELIKAFKQSCSRLREEFHSLEMELPDFTAVLDEMTKNTYVLVVAHDPVVEMAAIKMNVRIARRKFEELQGDSLTS